MSVSNNEVTLTGPTIVALKYIPNSFVITTGEANTQPPTIAQDGAAWVISIGADRKGSEDVANQFKNLTGGGQHEYAPSGGDKSGPGALNFFFGVTLTLQTDSGRIDVPVYLGQGHYSLTNNWWIGGNTVLNYDAPYLLAISNNQIKSVLSLSGGTSSFSLSEL